MPTPCTQLTRSDIAEFVEVDVFGLDASVDGARVARDGVGVELEWLTAHREDFSRVRLDEAEEIISSLAPLPRGSRLTVEPGGQLELSSAKFETTNAALSATATDLLTVDRACAARGIELIALGADPKRIPERVVTAPRYAAMEAFFDTQGSTGRTMMCNTAAIQLNVGLGRASRTKDRWRLANELGPTLVACFANSPFEGGGPSGWQSTRLRTWLTLDPSRCAPIALEQDPIDAYLEYALMARVMLIRLDDDDYRSLSNAMTFLQWMTHGHELGFPTITDFEYHLTTLFPPVRPRGWFEIRYFDALPTPFWHVAVALTCALLDDPEAADRARRAIHRTAGMWVDAARVGLHHPALAQSGRACFEIALEALDRLDHDSATAEVVAGYFDRWTARGRSPADDRLDAWKRDGTLVSVRESPVPYGRELRTGVDKR